MRPYLPLAILLAAAPLAHAAHVHGEGRLDVAIDREQLSLALELPLDAAVGFERAPKNAKEQAALAAAQQALDNAAALFVMPPAANCVLQSRDVAVPFSDGKPPADGGHADIDARYVFRCANPAALRSIETSIFKSFTRLYRLEVQRAGPTGQGAARLSPKQPRLSW